MNVMRIVLIAIIAFIALPFVATAGLQLYAAIAVANMTNKVQSAMDSDVPPLEDPLKGKANVVNARIVDRNGQFQPGYLAMATHGDINRGRTVAARIWLPLKSLLSRGERLPEKEFLEVFLDARATFVAEAECKRLLKHLASQCVVSRAYTVKPLSSKDVFCFAVVLRFVEKEDFRQIENNIPLYYDNVRAVLSEERAKNPGRREKIALSQFDRYRENIYRKAARTCSSMRRKQGNCGVTHIDISSDWNASKRALQVSAYGEFGFLTSRKIVQSGLGK